MSDQKFEFNAENQQIQIGDNNQQTQHIGDGQLTPSKFFTDFAALAADFEAQNEFDVDRSKSIDDYESNEIVPVSITAGELAAEVAKPESEQSESRRSWLFDRLKAALDSKAARVIKAGLSAYLASTVKTNPFVAAALAMINESS